MKTIQPGLGEINYLDLFLDNQVGYKGLVLFFQTKKIFVPDPLADPVYRRFNRDSGGVDDKIIIERIIPFPVEIIFKKPARC